MRRFMLPSTLFGTILAILLQAGGAQAQATRTWVSGVGDDANPCTRTAPCKNFAGAMSKTAAGGIINCLDSGGFGAVTINKSITIDCSHVFAGILAPGTNGVNITAAATDIVILRGIAIEGVGTGLVGISAATGTTVHVENCRIFGFRGGAALGISYTAPTGITGELYVSDTVIRDNGNAAANGGISMRVAGTGKALGVLKRVQLKNNSSGLRVDGTGGTTGSGFLRLSIHDSEAIGNTNNGITGVTPSTGAGLSLLVHNTVSAGNGGTGIVADGANAFVEFTASIITNNNVGVAVANGGRLLSAKNNVVFANITSNGTPVAETLSVAD